MKNIFILFLGILLSCCGTNNKTAMSKTIIPTTKNCPEEGTCTFEIINNKSISLKKDEIQGFYPEINEGNNLLLKFKYKRNAVPNTVDGNYSELLYLEVNPKNLELEKKDLQLKDVKLVFERLCFCKGQTGFYEITKGDLLISKVKSNEYLLHLKFETNEVPHIIDEIKETFILK